MAVTFIKCTNAGLIISGANFSVPVVKVVISGTGQFVGIIPDVYTNSIGMTAIASAFRDRQSLFTEIQSSTYGDNNGFRLSITSGMIYSGTYGIKLVELYYKGTLVGRSRTRTGSLIEIDPMCIFVDKDNNIYSFSSNSVTCLALDTRDRTHLPGWSIIDNKYVVTYIPSEYTLNAYVNSGELSLTSFNISHDISSEIDPTITDPYSQGGNTDVSEMTGDFDDSSDPVDFPSLPSIGAVDTGLVTLYNPSLSEIRALASYMWTNPAFDISAWKKIFADPIDAILGLSIVPVAVPDGGQRHIAVGNLFTDVVMNVAAQQYIELQCGSLNVNEFWSSYLDYEPYTKAEIYLPYCGVHQLSVDDIMNKTIEVRYHIDILTGSCCAYVKCGDSVLYQFIGQCSSSIPVASGDFSEIIGSALNAALAVGSLAATGGASAPFSVPEISANAVNILKEKIQKSGSLSGTGGMLAIQKPYLILTRPRQAVPANQNHYTGYPSFITENLSELSGYTEIEQIHLENVQATDTELNEIVTLLEGGVIF